MLYLVRKKGTEAFEQKLSRAVHKNKIPILTLDSRWHMLFPEDRKTATIKRLEENVNALLKKQGKLVQEAKAMKKLKRNFMQKIVSNMQETGSEAKETARVRKLEYSQRYILEINEKLKVYDDQLESIPKEIKEANEALLKASFERCYEDIKRNRAQIDELDAWINETKRLLKEKIVVKQDLEQNNTDIYSYMHDILGAEMMEVFDREHL